MLAGFCFVFWFFFFVFLFLFFSFRYFKQQLWLNLVFVGVSTVYRISLELCAAFSFQVPATSTVIESQASLNRVRWTHSGHQIAAGDDEGRVFIYDVGEVNKDIGTFKMNSRSTS